MTGFSSFGMGAGSAELMISMVYLMNGYVTVYGRNEFVIHIGDQQAQPHYFMHLVKGT